jgi:hypothetical protein
MLSRVASLCDVIAIILALTGSEEPAQLAQLLACVLRLAVDSDGLSKV